MADVAADAPTADNAADSSSSLNAIATSQGLLLEQLSAINKTVSQMGGIVLPVPNGGTGRDSLTIHNLLVGNGTDPVNFIAPSSTSGAALVSQGSSSDPLFGKVILTQPATVATLTIANNKTLTSSVTATLGGGDGWSLLISASKTVTISNTLTFAGTDSTTMTFPASNANVAALNIADQTLSGGANVTSSNLGTKSSGTLTIDCGTCPLQYVTNGGAFTLAAPANDGSCIVLMTNNGSAGAITFSGFTVSANTGDTLTTTNGNKFMITIVRINGTSNYMVRALQ